MDDFTPYGDAFETTLANLEKVLECCIQINVALSTKKCQMMMTGGILLGHYIFANKIKVDPTKIEVILKIPTPKTQKEVCSFLGHVGYYRRFIENFSKNCGYCDIGNRWNFTLGMPPPVLLPRIWLR